MAVLAVLKNKCNNMEKSMLVVYWLRKAKVSGPTIDEENMKDFRKGSRFQRMP